VYIAPGPFDFRQAIDRVAKLGAQQVDVNARFRQQATYTAALLVEQCDHHMYRLDELVILAHGQRLRIGKRHLEFAGQFVHSHGIPPRPTGPK